MSDLFHIRCFIHRSSSHRPRDTHDGSSLKKDCLEKWTAGTRKNEVGHGKLVSRRQQPQIRQPRLPQIKLAVYCQRSDPQMVVQELLVP
jgi:hypothetical protein